MAKAAGVTQDRSLSNLYQTSFDIVVLASYYDSKHYKPNCRTCSTTYASIIIARVPPF